MLSLVVLTLDADVAGHLGVALHRHRSQLQKLGAAEPAGLAELEHAVLEVVSKRQEAPASVSVRPAADDDLHDRDFLSRNDIRRLTGASLSSIDRWIASGDLPSTKHGRLRRVARADLEEFIRAPA